MGSPRCLGTAGDSILSKHYGRVMRAVRQFACRAHIRGSIPASTAKLKATKLFSAIALPLLVVAALIAIWTAVWASGIFHASAFPAPLDVVRGFAEEIRNGRLFTDLITSLF